MLHTPRKLRWFQECLGPEKQGTESPKIVFRKVLEIQVSVVFVCECCDQRCSRYVDGFDILDEISMTALSCCLNKLYLKLSQATFILALSFPINQHYVIKNQCILQPYL